jgi:tetratricopeptide (TPR) repeat protein
MMGFRRPRLFVFGIAACAVAVQCWASGLDSLKSAQDAEKAGDHKAALAAYGQAIKAGDLTPPQLSFVYYRSGAVNGYLGDNRRGIEDFTKSLELDPKRGTAYGMRGYLRGVVGQYDLAEKDHQAAIDLAKAQTWGGYMAWALQTRADLYRRRGKFTEALADCDLALQPGPNAMVNFRRASIYLDMGRKADAKAEFDVFEKAVAAKEVSHDALWPDERKALERLQQLR